MAKKNYLYKRARASLCLDPGDTYAETDPPQDVTQKQIEDIISEAFNSLELKSHEAIDRIKNEKEELRLALVEAGFPIPQGLRLGEWVQIIKDGADK